MPDPLRVLILEDNPQDLELMLRELRVAGLSPAWKNVAAEADFLASLAEPWDIILADYSLPQFTGLRALELLQERGLSSPFLIVSGSLGEERAVEIIKRGATDYVLKDRLTRLAPAVAQAVENHRLRLENKHAEEALRRERILLRTLIDNLPDSVYVKDLEGRKLLANPADLQLMGLATEAEAIGKTDSDLFPQSVAARFQAADRRVLETGQPILNREEQVTDRQGQTRWLLTSKLPLRNERGEIIGLIGIGHDFTGQKISGETQARLEDQLRQAQKMEAIGTLAGGIAHDFNNILGAIIGYNELARLDAGSNAAVQESLAEVAKASKRAKDLVQQILAFSRKNKPERKLILLQPVLKEAVKLLRASLPATLDMVVVMDPDTPMVLADATQMHQVLMNLCTNAAQAMKNTAGPLEVRLGAVQVDDIFASAHPELRPGRHVVLTVNDTGPGIAPEILKHIFDPFFTTKSKGEGTGLGLSVVHGIVKQHEGVILVYSQVNQGASFKVFLPAHQQAVPEEAPTLDNLRRGQGERVLFVDDEIPICESGRKVLEHLGYRVAVQSDPASALDLFRMAPRTFDLVITDLTMPGMTGVDLADKLGEIRPHTPVLLITGYSTNWTPQRLRAHGIRQILLKPFSAATLAAAVFETLHPC